AAAKFLKAAQTTGCFLVAAAALMAPAFFSASWRRGMNSPPQSRCGPEGAQPPAGGPEGAAMGAGPASGALQPEDGGGGAACGAAPGVVQPLVGGPAGAAA